MIDNAAFAAKVTISCVTGATAIVDWPIPIVYLAGSTPRATASVSISSAVGGTKKPILSIPIFIVLLFSFTNEAPNTQIELPVLS